LPYASAAGWEVTVGTMQLSYPVASFIGNTFTIGTTAAFSAGSSIAASGYVCSVLSSDSRETCGTIGGIGLTTALVSQALISSVPVPGGDKLRRPYLRKSTIEAIEANARIHKGKFIDPNTGQVINGPYQIGHKPGYEWKHWEKWAYKNNISQAELNEILNNPKYYLIELPINNMSHKFESDVFLGP
jgi:hypothetical protein